MISRKESGEARRAAETAGIKTYTGKFCVKHPENATRWVVNGCCVACTRDGTKPYRERNAKKLTEKRKDWDRSNPEKAMLQRAKRRAKTLGLDFDLTPNDIAIPEYCPVLGIKLVRCDGVMDAAPSLDRINNDNGYVRDNIVVISFRANKIKGNTTLEELRKVVKFYEQYCS